MATKKVGTTLTALAQLVGGKVRGDGSTVITGAEILSAAGPGEITLADHVDRQRELVESPAAVAIASADVDCDSKPLVVVDDVRSTFAKVVAHFRPPRSMPCTGICDGAHISPTAKLSEDVNVHHGASIGDDVKIGSGSVVHSGACIMAGCVIGRNVTIYPNAVLYENTRVGDRSNIHAGAVIGGYGFGFQEQDGRHVLCEQLGYVSIGEDVDVGANSAIDRGTYGATVIGDGTKIDNLVQIGHNCRIGRHNLLCSQVGIAGSTSTGDYVVMAGQVGVRDHVHIGQKAVLCSKAGVPNDVPDEAVMLGQPAAPLRRQKLQMAAISKLPEMRRDFRAMQKQLEALQRQLEESRSRQRPGEQAA